MPRPTTVRATSPAGMIKAVLLMLAFVAITASLVGELITGVAVGLFVFVFYRLVIVRELVCREHRKGVLLTKEGEYDKAIAVFQASERTWQRRRWVDEARGFVLASTGPHPYLWLARYNQAYCLVRLGRDDEAMVLLEDIVARRPEMSLARELRDGLRAAAMAAAVAPEEPAADPTWGGMVDDG